MSTYTQTLPSMNYRDVDNYQGQVSNYFIDVNYVIEKQKQKSGISSAIQRIFIHITVNSLSKKFGEVENSLRRRVETEQDSQKLLATYDLFKSTLDAIYNKYPEMDKMFNSSQSTAGKSMGVFLQSVWKFLSTLKSLEQDLRVRLYPERNEIILSYDEMRELLRATHNWEKAEEQSDIYCTD